MKKKGLIIATIVMVLVLAVSLTTATYAWFTVASTTTLQDFSVEVVANNDVNIGFAKTNTYKSGATANDFVNGSCTYTANGRADGALSGGKWEGTLNGLGPTITHNIAWGAQKKAVGVTSLAADSLGTISTGNTGLWNYTGGKTVIAANGVAQDSIDSGSVTAAKANTNGASENASSDFVHIVLGAAPARALKSNELCIMIVGDAEAGSIVGILSAIHVAYNLNNEGWVDVDVFAQADLSTDNHYSDLLADVTAPTLTAAQTAAWEASYPTEDAPQTGAAMVTIPGLTLNQGQIDQIEIVIYIAGADSDCRLEALGAKGSIKIFFATEQKTASQG